MTPVLVFVLLLLALIVWTSIPFIPALSELMRPRDAAPLAGVGNDSGELTWFADGFLRYGDSVGLFTALDQRYGAPFTNVEATPSRIEPYTVFELRDGTNVRVIRSAHATRDLVQIPGRPIHADRGPNDLRDIVVIDVPTALPDHLAVDGEMYARSDFVSGTGMRIRALLARGDADLAASTTVVRWIHAEGTLRAANACLLFGRATSATEIRLAPQVRFERMMAPRILIGDEFDEFIPPPTSDTLHGEPWTPPPRVRATRMSTDTMRLHGDLVVPEASILDGNFVITGALVLERGAQVHGSVKADGGLQLVGENIVHGSLTSRRDTHIGERSRVAGPVIGERVVFVHAHAFIGTPHQPTTVTGQRVLLGRGATVYGAVVAREYGETI